MLQSTLPAGEGWRDNFAKLGDLGCVLRRGLGASFAWEGFLSAFALDVVGDLVDLVEDVAVAVHQFGDFGEGVHDR